MYTKTNEELMEKSAAYQYGYEDALNGAYKNQWADEGYEFEANEYEQGRLDAIQDMADE